MKIKILLLSLILVLLFSGCEDAVENTCPYSVMIGDNIYYSTGTEPDNIKDVKILGKITSVVPESKMPSKNGEANVGTVDAPYGKYDNGIVVLINDEWIFFESKNARNTPDEQEANTYRKKENTVPFSGEVFNVSLSFAGTIIEEKDTYLIVEPNEDEDVRNISDRLQVNLKNAENRDYLYGEGRKIIVYYTPSSKSAVFEITATKILTDGYEDFEILPIISEDKSKYLVLTSEDIDSFDAFPHDTNSDLYYYGLNNVDVTVNKQTISLIDALSSGKITVEGIIKKANIDAVSGQCKNEIIKDGGSQIYKYDNLNIIRYHTIDGNRDIYIGSSDMDINVCDLPTSYPVKQPGLFLPADEWGLMMSVTSADTTGATLTFLQRGGNPTGTLKTGEQFTLEKKIDDEWIPVEYLKDDDLIAWHAIAYKIPDNDTYVFDIDWKYIYGNLEIGAVYRIGKEVMDFRKSGDYDIKTYYAEFAIVD